MKRFFITICSIVMFFLLMPAVLNVLGTPVWANDLEEIRRQGVLRHLGLPYAHFVRLTPDGKLEGLDVELMRRFARHLGVDYEWVESTWSNVFSDLIGKKVSTNKDGKVLIGEPVKVRGDIIANGLTILPWREQLVDYSTPTFPTGIWLMARLDSPLKPIKPTGNIQTDIERVKAMLAGRSVLSMRGTCIDPSLYDLASTNVDIRYFPADKRLDEIAPAIIDGVAEATLLDIPDALVALQKWPGEIKIIGPLSERQLMGVAVPKTSPMLLAEFNRFFENLKASGDYKEMVLKYYPSIFLYMGDFFNLQ